MDKPYLPNTGSVALILSAVRMGRDTPKSKRHEMTNFS